TSQEELIWVPAHQPHVTEYGSRLTVAANVRVPSLSWLPLLLFSTIVPDWPVVTSVTVTLTGSPVCAPLKKWTVMVSPELMMRGLVVAPLWSSPLKAAYSLKVVGLTAHAGLQTVHLF